MARWSVPVTAEDVPTGYGVTHVLVSGTGAGGTPGVLLPGGGATATAWAALAGLLSRGRPVVAVDPVGQPGLSTPGPRPSRTAADLVSWLDELVGTLATGPPVLIGHSYGAWMALH